MRVYVHGEPHHSNAAGQWRADGHENGSRHIDESEDDNLTGTERTIAVTRNPGCQACARGIQGAKLKAVLPPIRVEA